MKAVLEELKLKLHKHMILLTTLIMTCFFMPAMTAYAAYTPSGISILELESEIDALVNRYLGETTPGAAIVVVHDGEIIFSRGYGYANVSNSMPINPATTIFEFASISKTSTWVAVMQLAEQGIIDLDVNINAYLPSDFIFELPFTMRDLLNHSAGFGQPLKGVSNYGASLKDVLLEIQPSQIYKPGTASAYSNFGTALAGFAVEHIMGQSFSEYERENILIPAGMKNTFNWPDYYPDWFINDELLQQRARGHSSDFTEWGWNVIPDYPAGGLIGTAEDLGRWIIALTPPQGESGPLFETSEVMANLFTPSYLESSIIRGTNHGFMKWGTDNINAFGHPGNTGGFTLYFAVVPDERFGFAVLANAGDEFSLVYGAANLLLGNSMDNDYPTIGHLPSATDIEGRFLAQGRLDIDNTPLETLNLLAGVLTTVKAIDDNTIALKIGLLGFEATYAQVEPYVFKIISTNNYAMLMRHPELHFIMEDGSPVLLSSGNGWDLTPLERSMPIIITSLVLLLICAIYFLALPIFRKIILWLRKLIARIRKREFVVKQYEPATAFYRMKRMLLLCGLLFALNNIILIIILLLFTPIAIVNILVNYFILVWAVATIARSIFALRIEDIDKKSKLNYLTTVVLFTMFSGALWYWNFFSLIM
ncbi:MAG: beta-lactamase family protein [Lachnospiraceae bacterium]|nr:beta-lactamase family protein [Lachnospiraceae bacterium]